MKTSVYKFLLTCKNYTLDNFQFKKSYVSASTIKTVLKIIIILCWLVWSLSYSKINSINVPTFHIDGAFQTASGLYRLDAGQFPGKNFYPYLGIGPLFLLYPFFKVLGANLTASVFSAQFVVLLIGVLSVASIWNFIWKPRSFLTSLVAGNFLFLAPIGIANYFSFTLPDWMLFSISPGASLRPLRAAVPYFIIIIYYFLVSHNSVGWKKYTLSGLLTGSILLWSNDFAIPTAGLFMLFICAYAFYNNEFKKYILNYLAISVLSWIMLFTLATLGHPIELLKYNFLDVAKDQWWFFGPYDESGRIFNFQQLDRLFTQENYIPLLVLILTAAVALKNKTLEHVSILWIGTVLFTGGVLASIGGHLGGYFGSFYFWGMMTMSITFFRLAWLAIKSIFNYKPQLTVIPMLLILIVSLFLMVNSLENLRSKFLITKNDPNKFFVPELGGYLNSEWKDYIDLARSSKVTNDFEEYWGLWSATRKTFSNWPIDSVIHALGNTREIAAANLQNADTIVSTRYATSPMWQPWNLSENYWFYDDLLRNWSPMALSPTTIVWRRSEKLRLFKPVGCSFNNESRTIILQPQDTGFYEVEMKYNFIGNGRFLLMIKNNISFGADVGGYISFNPEAKSVKFPVYIEKEDYTTLDTKIIGQAEYDFNIKSCSANYITAFKDNSEVLTKPWWASIDNDFFVTDDNWIHGISRNWAGFFIPNAAKYANEYVVGKHVKFINGENRLITQVTSNGFYLRIYLDGEILKPESVGWPTEFIVTDN